MAPFRERVFNFLSRGISDRESDRKS
ncbi:hypothetical protein CCACVL1_09882 [Corchorus capsularis]|uniref:Uncharacterized protein n=1 Tax=Corchorus capsularis TaxID=210143 RepID=A0A1R3ITT8_COCAP|nr:hypothetical protein CCACVL1_09882 [Corchorus capsularis]